MSRAERQTAISTQEFLNGAIKLKINELEAFVRELNGLIFRKKTADSLYRQKELLRLINQTVLPSEKHERYIELSERLESETISETERQEFLQLAEEDATLRNQRVGMLIELAQLRNLSLAALMEEMGLTPPGRG
ncbi:MAG: hypothetical protein ACK4Q5_08675 [Saprospiraceae bacterium]